MTIKDWHENFKIFNEEMKSSIFEMINVLHHPENEQRFLQYSVATITIEKFLIEIVNDLFKDKDTINVAILDFIRNRLPKINDLLSQFLENPNESTKRRFNKFAEDTIHEYIRYKGIIEKENAINTENYYNKNINDLQTKIEELQKNLSTESKNKENAKREINELLIQKEIYERELAFRKKQIDVKEDWNNKIEETFIVLKSYLQPINNEQLRLKWLFWVYMILSGLLVVVVIIIEWIAIHKVNSSTVFPEFKEYITLFLPIPIVGAMLWAFIYQMNRAQRQLIVIAKSIHKVEYVQGLLLAINKLAPNVEDGITRINLALDKLINNHLNEKEVNSEEDIIKEEKKDIVPVDSLIKILKELKGVVGKE